MPARWLKASAHVIDMEVDNEWVVVDPQGRQIYTFNATGSAVWSLLRGGADWEDIARSLARQVEQPESQIVREVEEFVGQLVQRGLLVAEMGGGAPSSLRREVDVSPYVPPAIHLVLPLETRAGTPLQQEPDPLLDPLSPLRLIGDGKK